MTIERKISMAEPVNVEVIEVPPVPTDAATRARVDANIMLSVAQAFAVDSAEAFSAANEELKAIKRKINEIEAARKDLKAPILDAGRKVDELFKPALEILKAAEDACKKEMMRWSNEQQRIRREQEEEARKAAAKAEAARQKAMEKGDDKALAKAEARAAEAAASQIDLPEVPEVKGFYTIEKWYAEVIDFPALVKAVDSGKVDISVLSWNQKELDAIATAHKEKMLVPGVIPKKKDVAVSRSS